MKNITHLILYDRFFKKTKTTEKCVAMLIHMSDIPDDILIIHRKLFENPQDKKSYMLEMGTINWYRYKDILMFKKKHNVKIEDIVYGPSQALEEIVMKLPINL